MTPATAVSRKVAHRRLSDIKRDYYFDRVAARNIIIFFQKELRHVEGELVGQRIFLQPWQRRILRRFFGWRRRADDLRKYRVLYLELPRKNGKGVCRSTIIPTPGGWTTMGEIAVGDRVLDDQGRPCQVKWVSEDRFLDCYEVRFSNGEKIVCDGDHLWKTTARINEPTKRKGRKNSRFKAPTFQIRTQGRKKYAYAGLRDRQVYLGPAEDAETRKRFEILAAQDLIDHPVGDTQMTRVRDTRELYRTQRFGNRSDCNHSVKPTRPLDLPDASLLIEPYVLGAWLGDGCSNNPSLTAGKSDVDYMTEAIRACGYEVVSRKAKENTYTLRIRTIKDGTPVFRKHSGTFLAHLREIGVHRNKHIPRKYLRASYNQRLALLCGLMDTDGTVNKKGDNLCYTTVLPALRDGFAELLSTFGIKFSIREKSLRCNGRDLPGCSWNFQFNTFADELPVFRMPRKLARMRNAGRASARSKSLQIVSIEKIPSVVTRCISVDSPSQMFLCGQTMVPTHNSLLGAGIALYLLIADKEPGSKVVSAAADKEQATLVYDVAKKMVTFNPRLGAMLHPFLQTMVTHDRLCRYEVVSAEVRTKHGKNLHGVIFDELHAQPDRHLVDVLKTSMGARRQPVEVYLTTAGDNKNTVCYEYHRKARNVLDGIIEDETFLPFIYAADETDDWKDRSTWEKANPNLGVSIKRDYIEQQFQDALLSPSYENTFKRLHLNCWCVVPSTIFFLRDGTHVRADDLEIGDEVLSFDDKERALCWSKVELSVPQPASTIYQITTKRGRTIEVSEEHPFWCRSGRAVNPQYEWKTAAQLCLGDRIGIALGWSPDTSSSLDFETAWFFGIMVGDGSCSGNSSPRITTISNGIRDRCELFLNSHSMTLKVRSDHPAQLKMIFKGERIGNRSSPIRKLLTDVGLWGQDCYTKRVPEIVFQGGKTAVAGFISGYLDTDGCVTDEGIIFVSCNRLLLQDVQNLLAMLGCQSNLRYTAPMIGGLINGKEIKGGEGWRLEVFHPSGIRVLADCFDLSHVAKSDKLKKLGERPEISRNNIDRYNFDVVQNLAILDEQQPTIAVQIAGTHTHVTNGIITHNTEQETRWLPVERWEECEDREFDYGSLAGRECYAGLDLGYSQDVTALVLVFPELRGEELWVTILQWLFVPQESIVLRAKRDQVDYSAWVNHNWLHATPGNVTDYVVVRDRIQAVAETYDIREIAIDRANALEIGTQLSKDDGMNVVMLSQNFATLSSPTKRLEDLILGKRLRHEGNPVMRWMFSNIATVTDSDGRIRFSKKKAREKIDGMSALVNALSRLILRTDAGDSVYNGRGIVLI